MYKRIFSLILNYPDRFSVGGWGVDLEQVKMRRTFEALCALAVKGVMQVKRKNWK